MKFLAALLAFMVMAAPAHAKHHHHDQVQGDVIPDTNGLPYPITDHACDSAMDSTEYDTALDLCEQSAADYGRLAAQTKDPDVLDRLVYNEAYIRYEIAYAYNAKGDDTDGKASAQESYDEFRLITDRYFKKLEPILGWNPGERKFVQFEILPAETQKKIHAALNDHELHIGGGFIHLMIQVNKLYPDIAPEAVSLGGGGGDT
jgi:hypothetical protein